jgi:acyl carrier protein
MTPQAIRNVVLRVLSDIAPESESVAIKPDADLRDQLDIDSMDFLNFVIGLCRRLGIEVPEADYPKLATLDSCVEFLCKRVAASGAVT